MKRWICGVLALLLLLPAAGCAGKEESCPPAEAGLRAILDGMRDSSGEEEGAIWSRYYFQGQQLTVPGIEVERFTYILFHDFSYEILSVRQDGEQAEATLRLQNRYIPEALIYYWAWRDNEYVHFTNEGLLMQDGYYACRGTYTAELTLQLQYSRTLTDGERTLKKDGQEVSGWTICCTDEVIDALYGYILDTDYMSNGQRFLVTEETFRETETLAEQLARDMETGVDGEQLQQPLLRCLYYRMELDQCSSAWDYPQSDSALALLESLCQAVQQYQAGESVDLESAVYGPLAAMKAA